MSETCSTLAPHAELLNQLSAVATALELEVGELVLLAGLHDKQLGEMAQVTVDGHFHTMSLTTTAPTKGSPLHIELSRRGAAFACVGTESGAPEWLELSAKAGEVQVAMWRFEPANSDGQVGVRESRHGRLPLRRVSSATQLGALLSAVDVADAVHRLLLDIHPLLGRAAEPIVVCDSQHSSLAIHYRDVATSDALRVLAAIGDGPAVGDKFGRLCGTAGARQIDVLEINVAAKRRPSLRFAVELARASSSGAS